MATSVPTPKPGEKLFFSTMDAWNGYHSVPLEESAKKYFGFLTQWGTYRYKVVPQGFIGSGDHYVSVYNDIMNQLRDKEKTNPNSVFRCLSDEKKQWTNPSWKRCIDDTLLWATSFKQSFMQCAKYLTFCGQSGIIFNPRKLEVGRTEVNIFGLHVTQQGVLPTKNQIETMQKYPTPRSLRDMRGFLGLVNQATFCLGPETRKAMESLKDKMK